MSMNMIAIMLDTILIGFPLNHVDVNICSEACLTNGDVTVATHRTLLRSTLVIMRVAHNLCTNASVSSGVSNNRTSNSDARTAAKVSTALSRLDVPN